MKLLEHYVPGYVDLSDEERNALYRFAILWSVFEAQVFETYAKAREVPVKVAHWTEEGMVGEPFLQQELDYLRQRYTGGNETNQRFEALKLPDSQGLKGLVAEVLLGERQSHADELTAVLLIVIRFRNNFFHGVKWATQMRDQRDNFECSIRVMTKCIDRFGVRDYEQVQM